MCDEDPIFLKGVQEDYINHIKRGDYFKEELIKALDEIDKVIFKW